MSSSLATSPSRWHVIQSRLYGGKLGQHLSTPGLRRRGAVVPDPLDEDCYLQRSFFAA